MLVTSGRIVKKLLDTGGWCDDLCWIPDDRKLIVLHDKSATDKQDISVYTVSYQTRAQPWPKVDSVLDLSRVPGHLGPSRAQPVPKVDSVLDLGRAPGHLVPPRAQPLTKVEPAGSRTECQPTQFKTRTQPLPKVDSTRSRVPGHLIPPWALPMPGRDSSRT